jgi:microcystin-dependent protein
MAASKQIDFETGTPVTANFLDRIQEIQSGLATNLALTLSSSTTVTLPAGSGNSAVSLTIGDKFRYVEAPIVVTFSGSDGSGSYGLWATSTNDDSVSSFSVAKVLGSGSPTAAYSRRIGTVQWSGSALSSLVQVANYSNHGYMHTLSGDPLPNQSISSAQIVDGTITLGDLAASLQQLLVPTGAIMPYGGSTAPNSDFLLCDGGSYSTTTYSGLHAVIGYQYGGSGALFSVPDLRGRAPLGAGTGFQNGGSGSGAISGGTSLTARTRGQFGGGETHLLSAAESGLPSHSTVSAGSHGHTVSSSGAHQHTGTTSPVGNHNHGYTASPSANGTAGVTAGGSVISFNIYSVGATTTDGGAHSHTFTTDNPGGSPHFAGQHTHAVDPNGAHTHTVDPASAASAHNNMQPFVVTNWIIKV